MKTPYEFETKFREDVLRCSSCGFCQAVCPVYGATLRPSLNARGKMLVLKEIMDGHLELTPDLFETLCQCTTCASCEKNCPAGVSVPRAIKAVRRDMVASNTCHPVFKSMKEVLDIHSNIYAEGAPDFHRPKNQTADAVFFIGCVGSFRQQEVTEGTLTLLDRMGVNYTLVDEACCSGVLEDIGYGVNPDHARTNTENILAIGAKILITGCPYCLRTFREKEAYQPLRDFGIRVVHISEFLTAFDFNVRTEKVVTYHDPCDLGRHANIYDAPRRTIRKIASNFVEMPHNHENSLCCGAGGGVRAAYAKNAVAMARRRLAEADEVQAEIVLTECSSCLHNLGNAKLRKQNFEIYHTTQFINKLLDGEL